APFVMGKAETAYSRAAEIFDTTIGWRFVNAAIERQYGIDSMPETAENVAAEFAVSRADQDAFALRSQEKAALAAANGRLAREIAPVAIPRRKGDPLMIDTDEHPRTDTTIEALARLPTPFRAGGTVTAGNASGVNDGAAALVVASEAAMRSHGLVPLARVAGGAVAGVPPRIMGIGPVPASERLCARLGLAPRDFDVIELNEAFAAQGLAVLRALGIPDDAPHVNPNGGAIALGHPLGMSGARLAGTAALELSLTDGRRALATMCILAGRHGLRLGDGDHDEGPAAEQPPLPAAEALRMERDVDGERAAPGGGDRRHELDDRPGFHLRREVDALDRGHDQRAAGPPRGEDERRLGHRAEGVPAIEAAVVAGLLGHDHLDHPAAVRRHRGGGERRHPPAIRLDGRADRDHVEHAPGAEPALAAQRRLRDHLHRDAQRAPPGAGDRAGDLDEVAGMGGRLEVDALARGGDEVDMRMARRGDEGDLVHVGEPDAAEQRSVVVGGAGKDNVDELRRGHGECGSSAGDDRAGEAIAHPAAGRSAGGIRAATLPGQVGTQPRGGGLQSSETGSPGGGSEAPPAGSERREKGERRCI
ncbi:MAG: acetyl-CoA C-acyltransferase, partial [Rhizobiales bacterium]|nr:acetyl-CoA C-acyltransferase [Hyphomicrobiales bacterium]